MWLKRHRRWISRQFTNVGTFLYHPFYMGTSFYVNALFHMGAINLAPTMIIGQDDGKQRVLNRNAISLRWFGYLYRKLHSGFLLLKWFGYLYRELHIHLPLLYCCSAWGMRMRHLIMQKSRR